jgi:hypothetical protein
MQLSGLEHEFDLSGALPRLLYIRAPAPNRDPRLAALIARIAREASYRTFRTTTELGRLVCDDLASPLSERFAAARRPASTAARNQHRGAASGPGRSPGTSRLTSPPRAAARSATRASTKCSRTAYPSRSEMP